MYKSKLDYLKDIREAFKTYSANNEVDLEKTQRIYSYTNKLDALTSSEKQELDDFIKENSMTTEHLANIFLNEKEEEALKNKLNRMFPIQLTIPEARIKKASGNIEDLINRQKPKVKVLIKKAA